MAEPTSSERTAIITGTGGLGLKTALALSARGFRIVLAGRSRAKGAEALDALFSNSPSGDARFEHLDLASLASIETFVTKMLSDKRYIDVLVNNAGIMTPPVRQITDDGHEVQFGVNHLGHFALTSGLFPLLRPGARVISITSLAQHYAKLDLKNLNSETKYNAGKAYCTSKLLQAMFAVELQRRSEEAGWQILSLAAHPGFAATNLFQGGQGKSSVRSLLFSRLIAPLIGQSASEGALPIIHAATAPDVIGGRLYGPKGFLEMKGPPKECNFAKPVFDAGLCAQVWEISENMIGRRFANLT